MNAMAKNNGIRKLYRIFSVRISSCTPAAYINVNKEINTSTGDSCKISVKRDIIFSILS